MKNIKEAFLFVFLMTTGALFAQSIDTISADVGDNRLFNDINQKKEQYDLIFRTPKDHYFFEILGNNGVYSINYERILSKHFAGRIGFSYLPELNLGSYVSVGPEIGGPIGLSYLTGISNDLSLEIGTGFTLKYTDKGFWNYVTGVLGFRHTGSNGAVVRLGLIPLYDINANEQFLWFGFSIGKIK